MIQQFLNLLLFNKGKPKINYLWSRYIPHIEQDCCKSLRKLPRNCKLWFRLLQIYCKKTAVSGVVFSVTTDGYILIFQYMLIGWK